MKVICQNCQAEVEVDDALRKQVAAQVESEFRDKYNKSYKEALSAAKEKAKSEADEAARTRYEQAIETLNKQIEKDSKDSTNLLKQLQDAKIAKDEAEKNAQKKLIEEMDNLRAQAKAEADEANKIEIEALKLQLKQTSDDLKKAKETVDRGSQQIQGEALEQLVEKDLKDECRVDKIETVKTGMRGADIRQEVNNARGENCGVILWEIKNAKWQEGWIEKFKEDIAVEKASVGVIVVQDLPERFGDLGSPNERVFAIRPRTVKLLAALLRSKIIEVFDIGNDRKFSNQNIEAFYNYLTSGEFKAKLMNITETYKKLRELHNKDKIATQRRWGEYEKQLDKMERGAYTFIGELQGISNGEIGDIPLLDEAAGDNSDETA